MAWEIVPQTEKKGRGENAVEIEVVCKIVRYYPKFDRKGALEGTGMLKNPVLRIVIRNNPSERQHKLRYNHRSNLWTWEEPGTKRRPVVKGVKDRLGRPLVDELNHEADIDEKGEATQFSSEDNFRAYVEKRIPDGDLVAEIFGNFAERLRELLEAAAKKAA